MDAKRIKTRAIIIGIILLQAIPLYLICRKIIPSKNPNRGPDIQGIWEGAVEGPTSKIPVSCKISKANGHYVVTLSSPQQTLSGYFIPQIWYTYPTLHIEIQKLDGGYQASLNREVTEMSGKWETAVFSGNLVLKRTIVSNFAHSSLAETDYAARSNAPLQGYWNGDLRYNGITMQLHLKIAEYSDTKFRAEMDVPEEGIKSLPATIVTYKQRSVKLNFDGINGTFDGVMNDGHTLISGIWKQSSIQVPLVFNLTDPEAEKKLEAGKNYEFKNEDELQGHWHCVVTMNDGTKLPLIFNIAQLPDGTYTCSIDSPQQGIIGLLSTTFRYDPPEIRGYWSALNANFRAKLRDGRISGVWQGGDVTIPVMLERD